ncbi:hypothetical protein G9A89_023479 [Geosiphon pyriformis]|nr:hypothetical protein G9A89_023479 [Geosiphon pyriformis]
MAQFLTPDCLSEIFGYLIDNKQALHSCILVNRTWCEIAIPTLWRQPFRLLYSCDSHKKSIEESRQIRATKLLHTYLSYLTAEQISDLVDNQIIITPKPNLPKTSFAFSYVNYLRCLDLVDIHAAVRDSIEYNRRIQQLIEDENLSVADSEISPLFSLLSCAAAAILYLIRLLGCCKYNSTDSDVDILSLAPSYDQISIEFDEQMLSTTICRLFIAKCSSVKRLSIDISSYETNSSILGNSITDDGDIPRCFLALPLYPNANTCLSQLAEFVCIIKSTNTDIFRELVKKTELFRELAKISKNIRRMVVYLPTREPFVSCSCSVCSRRLECEIEERIEEVKTLAHLIKAQNELQSLELSCGILGATELMESLKTQAKSLERLQFTNTKFFNWESLQVLPDLTNLREIAMISCYGFTEELMKPLIGATFPKLRTLNLRDTLTPSSILESIIINCGNSLETLNLGTFIHHNSELSHNHLIQGIADYCPNLIHLEIYVTRVDFPDLENLFQRHSNLRTIILSGARAEIDIDWLLILFGKLQMNRLERFGIEAGWRFTPKSLEIFLKNTKNLAILEFGYFLGFNEDHLDVVVSTLGGILKELTISVLASLDEEALIVARSYFKVITFNDTN